MYQSKQLLGGKLSLKSYNTQVGETHVMIKVQNLGFKKGSNDLVNNAHWMLDMTFREDESCLRRGK